MNGAPGIATSGELDLATLFLHQRWTQRPFVCSTRTQHGPPGLLQDTAFPKSSSLENSLWIKFRAPWSTCSLPVAPQQKPRQKRSCETQKRVDAIAEVFQKSEHVSRVWLLNGRAPDAFGPNHSTQTRLMAGRPEHVIHPQIHQL